jgi:hypothetical protein
MVMGIISKNARLQISEGLAKKLEVFSASDMPDIVKTSQHGTHLEKAPFSSQSGFDMVFIS